MTAHDGGSTVHVCSRLAGSNVEFVFAAAPYAGRLWVPDPPGGKSNPTTSPDFADESIDLLNELVSSQGPFDGLLGFSQGGAMTVTYLAQPPVATFRFALIFCGYLMTTHLGLIDTIDAEGSIYKAEYEVRLRWDGAGFGMVASYYFVFLLLLLYFWTSGP